MSGCTSLSHVFLPVDGLVGCLFQRASVRDGQWLRGSDRPWVEVTIRAEQEQGVGASGRGRW